MPNTAILLSPQRQPAPAPQQRRQRKRAKAKTPEQESAEINYRRRRNIARLVVARHGRLAKAALCIPYAEAAAWHCPSDSERRFLMVEWCRWTCAPPSVERQIDAILAANPPRRIGADALARHLHVSDAERTALRIWSIGSYDVLRAARIKRRKEKKALAAKVRRQARGGKPREQALSRTKPWEAAGFRTRRTWERHGKPMSQIRTQYTSLSLGYDSATRTACGKDAVAKANGHRPTGRPLRTVPAEAKAASQQGRLSVEQDLPLPQRAVRVGPKVASQQARAPCEQRTPLERTLPRQGSNVVSLVAVGIW